MIDETIVEDTVESQSHNKVPRAELISQLRKRDGNLCLYPSCGDKLDFTLTDGPLEVTLDHWIPQHFGKANGWSWDRIWALSNLKLMHKKCNAKKGDRIPNEDGTLPERKVSTFRFRRQKRATRPELCDICDNGHNLAEDEICASCGANAKRFPRWAKVPYGDCDHAGFWCWVCSITPDMRVGATEMILLGGEGGED